MLPVLIALIILAIATAGSIVWILNAIQTAFIAIAIILVLLIILFIVIYFILRRTNVRMPNVRMPNIPKIGGKKK